MPSTEAPKTARAGLLMPPEVAGDLWLALNRQATAPQKLGLVNSANAADPLTQQERELYNELTAYFMRRLVNVPPGFACENPARNP